MPVPVVRPLHRAGRRRLVPLRRRRPTRPRDVRRPRAVARPMS
jgi:hypothetical protein